jgi:hypothetical protein
VKDGAPAKGRNDRDHCQARPTTVGRTCASNDHTACSPPGLAAAKTERFPNTPHAR